MNPSTTPEAMRRFVATHSEAQALMLRDIVRADLNRRFPPAPGEHFRLELRDREVTFEVNLREVEASELLSVLDAVAYELRHRAETFGRVLGDMGDYSDHALQGSLASMTDEQIEVLIKESSALERVIGAAMAEQLNRQLREKGIE